MVPSSETTEKSGGSGKAIAFVLGILALIMIFKKSTAAVGATPESVPDTGNDAGGGVSGGGTVTPTPVSEDPIISIPGVKYSKGAVLQNGIPYMNNIFTYGGYEYHTFIRITPTNSGNYAGMPTSPRTGMSLNSPYSEGSDLDCLKRAARGALSMAGMLSFPFKAPTDRLNPSKTGLTSKVWSDGEVRVRSVWPNPYMTTDGQYFPSMKTAQSHQDELNAAAGITPHHGLSYTATDGKTWSIDSADYATESAFVQAHAAVGQEANTYQKELNKIMAIGTPGPSTTKLLAMYPVGGDELWSWRADGGVYYRNALKAWMTLSSDGKSLIFNEQ